MTCEFEAAMETSSIVPVTVRPMRTIDLEEADRIFRLAFGTFLANGAELTLSGAERSVTRNGRPRPEVANKTPPPAQNSPPSEPELHEKQQSQAPISL